MTAERPATARDVDRLNRVLSALAPLPPEDRAWAIDRLAPAWWLRQREAAVRDGLLLVALGRFEGARFTRATALATALARRAAVRARRPGPPGSLAWLLDRILDFGPAPGAWTINGVAAGNAGMGADLGKISSGASKPPSARSASCTSTS